MIHVLTSKRKVAAVLGATLLGLVVGGGVAAAATGALSPGHQVTIQSLSSAGTTSTPAWPKNVSGQSYGSLLDSTSSATEPDLAKVIATNGKVGYVYSYQLDGVMPSNPEQAVASQATRTAPQYIPVYAQDGSTIIGQFMVSAPTADAQVTTTTDSK